MKKLINESSNYQGCEKNLQNTKPLLLVLGQFSVLKNILQDVEYYLYRIFILLFRITESGLRCISNALTFHSSFNTTSITCCFLKIQISYFMNLNMTLPTCNKVTLNQEDTQKHDSAKHATAIGRCWKTNCRKFYKKTSNYSVLSTNFNFSFTKSEISRDFVGTYLAY